MSSKRLHPGRFMDGHGALVYTSSVAAYGYHANNPAPLTEGVATRGSPQHYYSEQKAALERALAEITRKSPLEVFVLRPCIVAGPNARYWSRRCHGIGFLWCAK
jgi:nucleoside-diphosphate-sugar epimerase